MADMKTMQPGFYDKVYTSAINRWPDNNNILDGETNFLRMDGLV